MLEDGVRVEEDELPGVQVVEGNRACPDPPDELRRGPPQEMAHRVELALALEAVGGCCFARTQIERRQRKKKCRAQRADRKCVKGDEGVRRRLEKARE
jgi:hypothetical protein